MLPRSPSGTSSSLGRRGYLASRISPTVGVVRSCQIVSLPQTPSGLKNSPSCGGSALRAQLRGSTQRTTARVVVLSLRAQVAQAPNGVLTLNVDVRHVRESYYRINCGSFSPRRSVGP